MGVFPCILLVEYRVGGFRRVFLSINLRVCFFVSGVFSSGGFHGGGGFFLDVPVLIWWGGDFGRGTLRGVGWIDI